MKKRRDSEMKDGDGMLEYMIWGWIGETVVVIR